MDFKKIIVLLLILAIFSSISVASAGWFDFLSGDDAQEENKYTPALINSTVTIRCNAPQASDEYAYYYEDTGEYAGEAYYKSCTIDATFNFDADKIFDNSTYVHLYNNSSDLKNNFFNKLNDSDKEICISYMEGYDSNGTSVLGFSEPYFDGLYDNVDAYLTNNGTVLTVTIHYADEDYDNYKNDLEALVKVKTIGFDMDGEIDHGDILLENGDKESNYTTVFHTNVTNVPVELIVE